MAPCINSLVDKPIRTIGQYLFIVIMVVQEVESIGCFVCFSFNGSDPSCEDTFNSSIFHKESSRIGIGNYHYPCWALKKQRQGLFPADHCIKVNGHRVDDVSQTMVIRTCALDSGTFTADTEIVRISHCGHFKYKGHQYSGCVQSCDTDGCNGASRIGTHLYIMPYAVPVMVVVFAALHYQNLPDFMNMLIEIVNSMMSPDEEFHTVLQSCLTTAVEVDTTSHLDNTHYFSTKVIHVFVKQNETVYIDPGNYKSIALPHTTCPQLCITK
uniref:Protein quiver n=1 Tax=Setaria digitata TaxID=48799 RepID=A0A915PY20_9BILA